MELHTDLMHKLRIYMKNRWHWARIYLVQTFWVELLGDFQRTTDSHITEHERKLSGTKTVCGGECGRGATAGEREVERAQESSAREVTGRAGTQLLITLSLYMQ